MAVVLADIEERIASGRTSSCLVDVFVVVQSVVSLVIVVRVEDDVQHQEMMDENVERNVMVMKPVLVVRSGRVIQLVVGLVQVKLLVDDI